MKVKNICMIPQHKLQLQENQYYQEPCYGLLYIQEPASTDYLQTVCNTIAKLIEADGMETPATYNNLLNYNIYTTT